MSSLPQPTLPRADVEVLATNLHASRAAAQSQERLTVAHAGLNLADAYAIQDHGIRLRADAGERIIGYKMGLTSAAKREQMGLHAPIYGVLTDRMRVADSGTFALPGSIHPKIEPEVAFEISTDLRGVPTPDAAFAACSGVAAALEILDSRYIGFKYFSLPDVVADNSSSAFFVVGKFSPTPATFEEMAAWKMAMSVDGKVVENAEARAISGNPIHSLVQLCELLHERGEFLPRGSIVLAGAATQAVVLTPGLQVSLHVGELPMCQISIPR